MFLAFSLRLWIVYPGLRKNENTNTKNGHKKKKRNTNRKTMNKNQRRRKNKKEGFEDKTEEEVK